MNRHRLLEVFISNLANAIIHQILGKAIDKGEISEVYIKEVKNSWEIANHYRQKINPKDRGLSELDAIDIRRKLINKVKSELRLRIDKGYRNVDLSDVEEFVDDALKDIKIN